MVCSSVEGFLLVFLFLAEVAVKSSLGRSYHSDLNDVRAATRDQLERSKRGSGAKEGKNQKVTLGKCQNRKVSALESVRFAKCPICKVS